VATDGGSCHRCGRAGGECDCGDLRVERFHGLARPTAGRPDVSVVFGGHAIEREHATGEVLGENRCGSRGKR
jgi:hypothetical protein